MQDSLIGRVLLRAFTGHTELSWLLLPWQRDGAADAEPGHSVVAEAVAGSCSAPLTKAIARASS